MYMNTPAGRGRREHEIERETDEKRQTREEKTRSLFGSRAPARAKQNALKNRNTLSGHA
jgi:hypothetical protein